MAALDGLHLRNPHGGGRNCASQASCRIRLGALVTVSFTPRDGCWVSKRPAVFWILSKQAMALGLGSVVRPVKASCWCGIIPRGLGPRRACEGDNEPGFQPVGKTVGSRRVGTNPFRIEHQLISHGMFRKKISTGRDPHQLSSAKGLRRATKGDWLRASRCANIWTWPLPGFKTQQQLAKVFRIVCGN